MYEELLLEWNPWWNKEYSWQGIKRDVFINIEKNLNNDLILSLIGIRRAGKTEILFETIDHLLKSNIDKNSCFFIKVDDLRIKDKLSLDFINKLIELRESLFGKSEKLYLFFDEIQELDNWQQAIKTIYDLNKSKIKILITGSNASMLKKDLSNYLTGRKIDIEIYPFSFKEYLKIDLDLDNKLAFIENKSLIIKKFKEYINHSGFAEILFNKNNSEDYIKNLHETIILKDVSLKNKISNSKKILDISRYIMTNSTKPFNYLKTSKQFEISKDSFASYISYFEDVFLFFNLYLFDYSLKRQLINEKKIYPVDLGFLNYSAFKFSENKGRILENLVFIELKRRGKEIYYHKNKKECDFVIKEGLEIVKAIQVCKSLDDLETKKREIEGLLDACKTYNLKEGLILTEDEEGEEIRELRLENGEVSKIKIKILLIWKWLLVEN